MNPDLKSYRCLGACRVGELANVYLLKEGEIACPTCGGQLQRRYLVHFTRHNSLEPVCGRPYIHLTTKVTPVPRAVTCPACIQIAAVDPSNMTCIMRTGRVTFRHNKLERD